MMIQAPALKIAPLFLLLSIGYAEAKLKPEPKKTAQIADCVYDGEFTVLEPIHVGGHDVRPIAIGIGTLKVNSIVNSTSPICASQTEFDILFATGKNGTGGCQIPAAVHTRYEVSLRVLYNGSLAPAGCLTWLREL